MTEKEEKVKSLPWDAAFHMAVDETTKEFFEEHDKADREFRKLAEQRIRDMILKVFLKGYQLGYNDHASAAGL